MHAQCFSRGPGKCGCVEMRTEPINSKIPSEPLLHLSASSVSGGMESRNVYFIFICMTVCFACVCVCAVVAPSGQFSVIAFRHYSIVFAPDELSNVYMAEIELHNVCFS